MLAEITTTYLRMTDRAQLVPSSCSISVTAREASASDSVDYLRSLHERVGKPHQWRWDYTDERWREWFAKNPRYWIIEHESEAIGILVLEVHEDHAVEIRVFGLMPEFVGRGLGGQALTVAAQIAWDLPHPDEVPTAVVWLHTCTQDHPNAINNYRKRGFVPYKTETEQRELPTAP